MRTNKIDELEHSFHFYGYSVIAEPIEGQEAKFEEHLESGLIRIRKHVKSNEKRFGFRLTKLALKSLHRAIPEPVWGVEVR